MSLVELLVALVLFGIVSGAILRAFDRQVRLHTSVLALLEARARHAATHEMLAVTLRGLSPPAGDLVAISDSAIVARLPLGGGVACAVGANRIVLGPDSLGNNQALTRLLTAPQPGDTLWVLDEGPTDATIDDRWEGLRISAATRFSGACTAGTLLGGADALRPAWRFDVGPAVSPTILEGAPARLTRHGRFALYRSGSESWLGFVEWNAGLGAWNTIQPVDGPYLPYNRTMPAASGIALAPRDSNGVLAWGAPSYVSALAFTTRTETRDAVRADGMRRGLLPDSLTSIVGLRNAR